MKVKVRCPGCHRDNMSPNPPEGVEYLKIVDVVEGLVIDRPCERGHEQQTILLNRQYQLLYESGVSLIILGFPREAISAFMVSLERFYEYALRVILRGTGIDPDTVSNLWKRIKSSSERQLGAFHAVWLGSFGTLPDYDEGIYRERNRALHAGEFFTEAQAVAFGEKVLHMLRTAQAQLIEKYQAEIDQMWSEKYDFYMKQEKPAVLSEISTLLRRNVQWPTDLSTPDQAPPMNLKEHLAFIRDQNSSGTRYYARESRGRYNAALSATPMWAPRSAAK